MSIGMYGVLTEARVKLQAMFSIDDTIIEAAASVAQKRYAGSPWADDHGQDAALYAVLAYSGDEELEIARYCPEKPSLYGKAKYVLGIADGYTRKLATSDGEDSGFVQSFCDLIPNGIEDEDEWLERKVGGTLEYSPVHADVYIEEYDPRESALESSAFYVTQPDGARRCYGVREIAQLLMEVDDSVKAEALASDDFHAVAENFDDIVERILTWAVGQDGLVKITEEEDTSDEFCPLIWTISYAIQDGACDLNSYRKYLDDGRAPDYSVQYDPTTSEMVPEDAEDKNADGAASFGKHSDMLKWADDVAVDVVRIWKKRPWDYIAGAIILVPSWFSGELAFKSVAMSDYDTWVYAYTHEIHTQEMVWFYRDNGDMKLRNIHYVAIALGMKPGQKWYHDADMNLIDTFVSEIEVLNDNEITAVLNHIAGKDEANYAEFLGFLVRVTGERLMGTFDNDVQMSATLVRQLIVDEVSQGTMFPSQAVILFAKLDGKHQSAANRLGQAVYDKSLELKKLLQQRRVAITTEMLWAEAVYPCFNLGLKRHVVSIVGHIADTQAVEKYLANLDKTNAVVVGCDTQAQEIATKLGMHYIDIPVSDYGSGMDWAQMQVLSCATIAIIGKTVRPQAIAKQLTAKLEIRYVKVL